MFTPTPTASRRSTGDALRVEDLNAVMPGQDVVYCAISGDALPKVAENIVAAMTQSGVKRLLFMGRGRHLQRDPR